jgi:hypothetical protein
MLDVVKFTWRNAHGYWIPVAWMTVPSETTDTRAAYPSTVSSLQGYASLGRPSMTDFKVLDRMTIPEKLRLSGSSGYLLSTVMLYDKKADDYSAKEMIEAMTVVTA